MSSFAALRRAHADARFKCIFLRPTLASQRLGCPVSPFSCRLNSSTSESHVSDAPTEETPIVASEKTVPSGDDTLFHKALTPSGRRDLADRIIQDGKELHKLNVELKNLQRFARSTELLVKGSPWKVAKHWFATPFKEDVTLDNGVIRVGSQTVPNIWLRDNCQCNSCMHQETRQRLLDTFSIPEDISIKTAAEFRTAIEVTWSDGHQSTYDKDLLREAGANSEKKAVIRQGQVDIHLWNASIAESKPQLNWEPESRPHEKRVDKFIQGVLQRIRRFGFCYVNRMKATPEATEKLLRRIAFIRETHYGGFYDFTADLASKDTAYTNIALGAHTDNTYFSDPAGLQAFHLLSHTDGKGGASLLVDGFKAAEELLHSDKEAYHILATVHVHGHASGNDGISIQPYKGFPVLEHDAETGALLRVRWNPSDRAAVELPLEEVGKWYAAARKFDAILKRKENEYWEQLQPGTLLIFDNWRVLHGRSAFTGKRRICGGYINRDDWISKYKMLHFGKEDVLKNLAAG